MTLYYAGIGSRKTPQSILNIMYRIAERLNSEGFTLRSGGADGADTAFEAGAGTNKEIYLPWRGFNSRKGIIVPSSNEVLAIAKEHHPNWDACSIGARAMHCRNVYQVLGADLNTPSSMVICWTPNGDGGGGTGQALRIARTYNIPIHDLGDCETCEWIKYWLDSK